MNATRRGVLSIWNHPFRKSLPCTCFGNDIELELSNTWSKQCPPWISSPMCLLMRWWPLIFSRIVPKPLLKSLANLSLLVPFYLLVSHPSFAFPPLLILPFVFFLSLLMGFIFLNIGYHLFVDITLIATSCLFIYGFALRQSAFLWYSLSLFKCHVCVT